MWPFRGRLGKRTARVATRAVAGAALGATAGVLFGLLYGTLLGAIHGELAAVLFLGARFALAGGIAGFLVAVVGEWVVGEGLRAGGPRRDQPHGMAGGPSGKSGAGGQRLGA
jgi:hypothetical protein